MAKIRDPEEALELADADPSAPLGGAPQGSGGLGRWDPGRCRLLMAP